MQQLNHSTMISANSRTYLNTSNIKLTNSKNFFIMKIIARSFTSAASPSCDSKAYSYAEEPHAKSANKLRYCNNNINSIRSDADMRGYRPVARVKAFKNAASTL